MSLQDKMNAPFKRWLDSKHLNWNIKATTEEVLEIQTLQNKAIQELREEVDAIFAFKNRACESCSGHWHFDYSDFQDLRKDVLARIGETK